MEKLPRLAFAQDICNDLLRASVILSTVSPMPTIVSPFVLGFLGISKKNVLQTK